MTMIIEWNCNYHRWVLNDHFTQVIILIEWERKASFGWANDNYQFQWCIIMKLIIIYYYYFLLNSTQHNDGYWVKSNMVIIVVAIYWVKQFYVIIEWIHCCELFSVGKNEVVYYNHLLLLQLQIVKMTREKS